MAKKTKPENLEVTAEEPTVEEEPTVVEEPFVDPTLLGVQVPLTVTFGALKQVTEAWKACFVDLGAAARAKLLKSGSAPEVEATTIEA